MRGGRGSRIFSTGEVAGVAVALGGEVGVRESVGAGLRELSFEAADGARPLRYLEIEEFVLFVWEDDEILCGEAVGTRVFGGDVFAFRGAGISGELGVGAIGFDLRKRGHGRNSLFVEEVLGRGRQVGAWRATGHASLVQAYHARPKVGAWIWIGG